MKVLQRTPPTQYIALSHRWPTAPILRLTYDSMERFTKAGILRNELPITFQHVVLITDQLGPRFLWIVSLLIAY